MNRSNGHSKAMLKAAILASGICLVSACKKLISVGVPQTLTASTEVFSTPAGATSALKGIYASIGGAYDLNTTLYPGLSADELVSYSAPTSPYYTNTLNPLSNDDFWSQFYSKIYQTNELITKLKNSTGVEDSTRKQLIAETTFLRGFFHFYLVNYFGDIPYVTSSDYTVNSAATRLPAKDSVYPLIIKDLQAALAGLSTTYPSGNRIRVDKAVATALLARVYLYLNRWTDAAEAAGQVINDPAYKLETLQHVFLGTSQEAIWQLSPDPIINVASEYYLSEPALPAQTLYHVAISDFLYNAFDSGDLRQSTWISSYPDGNITYHYPYKYQTPTACSTLMRLAEQYLIRAEANAQLGDITDAVADLNLLRARAGIKPFSSTISQTACLAAVRHERQTELFVEWGHRWFDLKRTGAINTVMPSVCAAKGGDWSPNWALYPIPVSQLNGDPNMANEQNPGY